MTSSVALSADGRRIQVSWLDGERRELSARWLFDHADGARDPISGQRPHGALAASDRIEVAKIEGETLQLCFADGARRQLPLPRLRTAPGGRPPIALWPTADSLPADLVPFTDYLRDEEALRVVLDRVARYGLAVLAGAGDDPDAVEKAVARFGFVRETNYGRCFDVKIEPRPGNLAYTDLALDLHTDNPYRDPPPTLQLLHAITTDAVGGATYFVDGFAHARALAADSPAHFELLALTPARFSYAAEDGACWSCTAPVLGTGVGDELEVVRLNHRSLDLAPADAATLEAWYGAYLDFYRRVHAPGAAFERRLAPGEMVIFDNRRLLHGRRVLTSASPRWLRGCYADVDGLMATLAKLERSRA